MKTAKTADVESAVTSVHTGVAAGSTSNGVGTEKVAKSARRKKKPDLLLVVVGALIAVAVVLLAVPLVGVVVASFGPTEGLGSPTLSFHNFIDVFSSERLHGTLLRTLLLGVGTVAVSLAVAVPLAWLYARTSLRTKNIILVAAVVKMAIPGFLVAMGYIFLLNPSNGIVNTLWKDIFGGGPLTNIYSLGWIIFLQGIDFAGPVFFMIVPTMRVIDVNIEEAAAVHGIGRWRASLQLLLPIAMPTIMGVAIFHFIVAIEIFDYAGMLGLPAGIEVLSTLIFSYAQGSVGMPEFGRAAALGVAMAIAIALIMWGYNLAMRKASQMATITGKRAQRAPIQLSARGDFLGTAFIVLYVVVGAVVPILMIFWAALLPYIQPPSVEALSQLSFDSFANAWPDFLSVLPATLSLAVVVPTVSVLLAALAAWVVLHTRVRLRKALDSLIMTTLAIPSIVLALAFLIVGIATHRWLGLYGTIAFLTIAVTSRYIVVAYRTVHGNMLQMHGELEEAAAVSGVRRGRSVFQIVMPTQINGLLFAWLWIALLAVRELTITVMFSGTGTQVLATRIFGYISSGNISMSAALGVMHLGLISVFLISFLWFTRKNPI